MVQYRALLGFLLSHAQVFFCSHLSAQFKYKTSHNKSTKIYFVQLMRCASARHHRTNQHDPRAPTRMEHTHVVGVRWQCRTHSCERCQMSLCAKMNALFTLEYYRWHTDKVRTALHKCAFPAHVGGGVLHKTPRFHIEKKCSVGNANEAQATDVVIRSFIPSAERTAVSADKIVCIIDRRVDVRCKCTYNASASI